MQSGGRGVRCAQCAAENAAGARFCQRCGSFLLDQRSGPGPTTAPRSAFPALTPLGSAALPPPGPAAGVVAPPVPASPPFPATDQTPQGLLFLAIGFLIGWIPFIGLIGGILTLVGLIYVYNGRDDLGPEHHRTVVRGLVLIVVGVAGGFATSAIAAFVLFESVAVSIGGTGSPAGPSLGGSVILLVALATASAVLGALGRVLLVWVPADRSARIVLWAGFALLVPISVVAAVLPLWVFSSALSASSTASYDSWTLGLDLLDVVPAVLFAWAYLSVRARLRGDGPPPGVSRAARYKF